MKIFQTAKQSSAFIGIYQIDDKRNQFNRRNLAFLLLYGLFTALAAAFLFFEANTMQDYGLCFFALLSASLTFIDFFVFIQKAYRNTRLVERIQITLESRKSELISKLPLNLKNKSK